MAVLHYIVPAIYTGGNLTTLCPRGHRVSNNAILCEHLEFAYNIAGDSGIPESLRTRRRCAEHAKSATRPLACAVKSCWCASLGHPRESSPWSSEMAG